MANFRSLNYESISEYFLVLYTKSISAKKAQITIYMQFVHIIINILALRRR